MARSGAASGMRAIRACPGAGGPSLNPIRASQPWGGAWRGAQARRGGSVRSPGDPAPEGPRALLSPPPPLPAGSSRPGLGLAGHLRFPVPTSGPPTRTDVQILAAPGWVPDLRRSPSSRPPDLLSESTAKARTSVGGEGGGRWGSTSSQSPITDPRHPQAGDRVGPQAASARSTPRIDSQVFSLVVRDPLAALCGIFPRDPLPSLGRHIPRLPNRDSPLHADPEPGEIHRVPTSSPANFANFSPGASAEQKLGGHRPPPPPQPLRGPGTGGRQPAPTAGGRRTTYPAAAAACPRRAATCPQPVAPARAAAAQRSLACWGRGLGRGSAPVAMGTAAGGACAEGPGAERCRPDPRGPAGS